MEYRLRSGVVSWQKILKMYAAEWSPFALCTNPAMMRWKVSNHTDAMCRRILLVRNYGFDNHNDAAYLESRERRQQEHEKQRAAELAAEAERTRRTMAAVTRKGKGRVGGALSLVSDETWAWADDDEGDEDPEQRDSEDHSALPGGTSSMRGGTGRGGNSTGHTAAGLSHSIAAMVTSAQSGGGERASSQSTASVSSRFAGPEITSTPTKRMMAKKGRNPVWPSWALAFQTTPDEKPIAAYAVLNITAQQVTDGELFLSNKFVYFHPERGEAGLSARTKPFKDKRWRIDRLTQAYGRRYLLRPVGLELFFADSHEIFFAFADMPSRKRFFRQLRQQKPLLLQTPATLTPHNLLAATNCTLLWQQRKLSNFEYLMRLNIMAGRSFNDITQYPVFPWVIADYTSETLDLDDPHTFRDLSKPVGALNEERLEEFLERYRALDDPEMPKFMYGSHYSSAGVVLHYLVRQEPFTSLAINLQGGRFDCPDRLFFDMQASWESCTHNMTDVKELIPEFYCFPEFLLNTNRFNLGELQDDRGRVDDVRLPPWADDAYDFVRKNRLALESEYVTTHLHHWIDLVFGFKQRGPEAEKANNVFYYLTYEGAVDVDQIEDPLQREATKAQIIHFGQTPSQLLTGPHPERWAPHMCNHTVFSFSRTNRDAELRLFCPERQTVSPQEVAANPAAVTERGALISIAAASDRIIAVHADLTVSIYRWSTLLDSTGHPFTIRLEKTRHLPSKPLHMAQQVIRERGTHNASIVINQPELFGLPGVEAAATATGAPHRSTDGVLAQLSARSFDTASGVGTPLTDHRVGWESGASTPVTPRGRSASASPRPLQQGTRQASASVDATELAPDGGRRSEGGSASSSGISSFFSSLFGRSSTPSSSQKTAVGSAKLQSSQQQRSSVPRRTTVATVTAPSNVSAGTASDTSSQVVQTEDKTHDEDAGDQDDAGKGGGGDGAGADDVASPDLESKAPAALSAPGLRGSESSEAQDRDVANVMEKVSRRDNDRAISMTEGDATSGAQPSVFGFKTALSPRAQAVGAAISPVANRLASQQDDDTDVGVDGRPEREDNAETEPANRRDGVSAETADDVETGCVDAEDKAHTLQKEHLKAGAGHRHGGHRGRIGAVHSAAAKMSGRASASSQQQSMAASYANHDSGQFGGLGYTKCGPWNVAIALDDSTSSSKILSCGYWDHMVKCHSGDSQRELASARGGHLGAITCLELGSDLHTLLTGGLDGSIRVWVLDQKSMAAALSDLPAGRRTHLGVAGFGDVILGGGATGAEDGGAAGIGGGAHGEKAGASSLSSSGVSSAGFSSSGTGGAGAGTGVGGSAGELLECVHILFGHETPVTCMSYSHALDLLVSGSECGHLVVHRVRQGRFIRRINTMEGLPIHLVKLTVTGEFVAHSWQDSSLHVFSVNGTRLHRLKLGVSLMCMEVSWRDPAHNCVLVCGGVNGVVSFRDVATLEELHSLDISGNGAIRSLRFLPDEQYLLIGSENGLLSVCTDPKLQLRALQAVIDETPFAGQRRSRPSSGAFGDEPARSRSTSPIGHRRRHGSASFSGERTDRGAVTSELAAAALK